MARTGERISRRYHVMAKLHKIGNKDKRIGIEWFGGGKKIVYEVAQLEEGNL